MPLVSPNAPQCITDVNLRDLLKKLKAHRAHLSPDEELEPGWDHLASYQNVTAARLASSEDLFQSQRSK